MDEVMSSLVFLLAKSRTVCDGNMTNNLYNIYTLYSFYILKKNVHNNYYLCYLFSISYI